WHGFVMGPVAAGIERSNKQVGGAGRIETAGTGGDACAQTCSIAGDIASNKNPLAYAIKHNAGGCIAAIATQRSHPHAVALGIEFCYEQIRAAIAGWHGEGTLLFP